MPMYQCWINSSAMDIEAADEESAKQQYLEIMKADLSEEHILADPLEDE